MTVPQVAHELMLLANDALDEVPAPEDVRPGWIAMGSFFLLFAVTILLWLSMRKQLTKIDFDEDGDEDRTDGPAGTDSPEDTESHGVTGAENGEARPQA